ncbi:type II toxin-antitoxin system RelB/DinJ family antitoxin [Arcobacter lacus]|uniref:type II toxin-antitoxin system RelB/DinJ family antitoxin n=1 Tax=Arcobacter lacus TaxID=1912876 RepID=UPI0021BB2E35|nr:type II toxin-antitoxin system RelB/DinJ family antitoxin [Arcobacter lacus]MCT7909139.1 type II toxin-antitoxin system RelB/DinJ family antitoxin [Arcobacter lacus]
MTQVRETTSIKLDKTTKEKAKVIFEQLGVNMGEAINMFLTQVVLNKGIPFNIKLPNEETQKAMKDIVEGKNIEKLDIKELKR